MRRIVLLIGLSAAVMYLMSTTAALAASDGNGAAPVTVGRQFDHFVGKGGVITWFILIPLSIATIALIVEHSVSIRRSRVLPSATVQRIRADLESKRYIDAIRFTAGDLSPLAAAINSGLAQAGNGYHAMQRAVADSVEQSAARMMRKIEYLNVIGNVSPMIGLFGTVYGMIGLFASISEAGGIPEPAVIADNISIALITTFWGLVVAIPALSVFAFFRNRIDELSMSCAATADKLLSAFEPMPAANGATATALEQLVT